MAGGEDLNLSLSRELPQGKNPGWWKDARNVSFKEDGCQKGNQIQQDNHSVDKTLFLAK